MHFLCQVGCRGLKRFDEAALRLVFIEIFAAVAPISEKRGREKLSTLKINIGMRGNLYYLHKFCFYPRQTLKSLI